MNNFTPKKIKIASKHLSEQLKLFKLKKEDEIKSDVYVVEDKKSSSFDRLINLIFKS